MSTEHAPDTRRIAERLRGRHVLLTGATGLLGKAFLEKLLRSVPDIGGVHLLVRAREDGTTGRERIEREVLNAPVFQRLRALLGPQFEQLCREKVHVVDGDLTLERLGLSDDAYRALQQRIDVVVNSAATVTFDERLDLALTLNTRGPSRLLDLARDAAPERRIGLLQVSTCYVNGQRGGDIPETLSTPPDGRPLDIDALLAELSIECEQLRSDPGPDGETLRRRLVRAGMEAARRRGWNDTYTFTKWLGEQLVARDRGPVPLVILRPAIIEGSLNEPVPGWIDGLRMADPMIIAYGRGKLREFPADPEVAIDLIPVDLVVNAMIAAMPEPHDPPGLRVYQVGSSARNPLHMSNLVATLVEAFRRRPLHDEQGHPIRTGTLNLVRRDAFETTMRRHLEQSEKSSRRLHRLPRTDYRRRRLRSARTEIEQLQYLARIYAPYTHLNCRFCDDALQALAASLHPDDREPFAFDAAAIDWRDYIAIRHIPGLCEFVLSGAGQARRPGPEPVKPLPDDQAIRSARDEANTLFDAFRRVAGICNDKPALQIQRGGRWCVYTYAEALATTGAIARRFAEYGLRAGDRVVICAENGPEWGLTYLAAMRAGLTAVPLDPQLPAEDVLACARFTDARLVCAGRSMFDAIRQARHQTADGNGERYLGEVVALAEPFVPPPGAARDPGPDHATQDSQAIASILFTSGTTVAPKAVPLTHQNFLANVRSLLEVHPHMGAGDNFLSVLPMYHVFEFTGGFLIPMTTGATITYVEQLKGPEIVAAMQATGTTVMLAVPRLLKLFHDAIERKVSDAGPVAQRVFRMMGRLSDATRHRFGKKLFGRVHRQFGGRLRMFVSGGSSLDPELHTAYSRIGFEVCEAYGLTETAPGLTISPPGACRSGSVGQVLPGVDLEVRQPDRDGIGELWARGPNVMVGYWKNPDATAEVIRDGWFRTGDLGRRDENGYLYLVGRSKDLIVTDAGKNVYPDEIEVRYRELPFVKELCVLGMPTGDGVGESVHAVVVPDVEAAPDLDPSALQRTIREAAAALTERIPSHQRIRTFHFWNVELPKTSTLKARRGVIRARLLEGVRHEPPADSARQPAVETRESGLTPGESFVRQLLARLSRQPESTIRRDSHLLLDLGMDSLMKLQFIGELEAHFDVRIPDEKAAAVTRVADVEAFVRHRAIEPVATGNRRSWKSRLHRRDDGPVAPASHAGSARRTQALLPARWTARGGLALFLNSYIRVRAEGVENIPTSGPFILAANHSSHLDSVCVLTAVGGRRRVWIAGAEDYFFNQTFKSWLVENLFDMIPFDRQAEGFEGLRRCIDTLRRGEGLLFFPEGTRSITGRMQSFKVGVAVLAEEGGAPVIPTFIDNAHRLMPKGQRFVRPGVVRVRFGAPIMPESTDGNGDLLEQHRRFDELTNRIRTRVESLDRRDNRPRTGAFS